VVRNRAAATFERVGSHDLHSIREFVFLRSPLTETPRTAFLVHSERPSRRTPQASLMGLRDNPSSPRWLGKPLADVHALLVNLCYLFLSPRFAVKMINANGD